MAQATGYQHPNLADKQEAEQQGGAGDSKKTNVLGKLKEKTKHKTSKLKNKLKPGSRGNAGDKESSSSSSSEDEADTPTNNAFSGMTQPEYDRKLHSGELSPSGAAPESPYRGGESPVALGTEEFNKRSPNDFPPSHGQEESALTKQFEGLSTDDKPSSQTGAVDVSGVESIQPHETEKDDILSKAGDPRADDSTVEQGKPDPEGLLSEAQKSGEAPKSWGQWVGEKVGLAKPSSPTSGAETTATATGEKPLTEKIKESLTGAKDAVVAKTSGATDAAKARADETKESTATTDPQKQTYTQKLTGAIYGAKDSLMSSTHPGDDEKALSQKVTETVSNLPTTIKSTLGFGKGQAGAATSPTTTPATGTLDTPMPTEDLPSAPPTSPGLVSRITGSVTSLFGKKPSDSPPASSGQVDDSTATPTSGVPTSETIDT